MNRNAREEKLKISLSPWIVITGVVYVVLMGWLHYRQAGMTVSSDMQAYLLTIQGIDSGYSFPYPLFFVICRFFCLFFSIEWSVTIVLSILNALAYVSLYRFMKKYYSNIPEWAVSLMVLVAFTVSMLFYPLNPNMESQWWNYRYLGVFSPNPYQNATYLATRPFSILLFAKFADIEFGERKISDYLCLSVWMLLSVLAKPSFAFIFFPVIAGVTISDAIKSKRVGMDFWKVVIAAIPAIIALLFQFSSVFGPTVSDTEGGIHFGFAVVWHYWTKGIKTSFIKANFFPIIFLLIHLKDFVKDRILRYAWYSFIVGFISFICLYEGGFRMADANFAWGYMHGMFFTYCVSGFIMVRELFGTDKRDKIRGFISLAVFIPHLVCGIIFMVYVMSGGSVYTF